MSSGSSSGAPGAFNTPLEERSATNRVRSGPVRTEPARGRGGTQIDSAPSAREVCELVEKRYMRRGLALAVTASIALAACTQTPSTGSPTPGASASASAAPGTFSRGQGGELKILYWQAPTILNSHQATGTKDYDASRLILGPMASWGVDGKPAANDLAKEIPTVENKGVSADFTTVTWNLLSGLKWS